MAAKEQLQSESEQKVKEPAKYAVVLHNDHYTTMDFVVNLLIEVFNKDPNAAKQITYNIHLSGRGVAGVYPFEIAEEKYLLAQTIAEKNEQPLQVSMEEV
jgi:ATP-dependent Clp protease adaptor protein ClpS